MIFCLVFYLALYYSFCSVVGQTKKYKKKTKICRLGFFLSLLYLRKLSKRKHQISVLNQIIVFFVTFHHFALVFQLQNTSKVPIQIGVCEKIRYVNM